MRTPSTAPVRSTPCAVAEALEGFEFDGLGNGPTLYRAEDHQCFKDVLVVKGKENPTSEFDLLEIVEVTPVEPGHLRPRPPADGWREMQPRLGPVTRAHKPDLGRADHCRPANLSDRYAGQPAISFEVGNDGSHHPSGCLNGLTKGSAYALIALGLTLIFGTLGVVNFAHGALFMIGAFCAVTCAAHPVAQPSGGRRDPKRLSSATR